MDRPEGIDERIDPPTQATLRKYGGTPELWWEVLVRQGGVCPICGKVPTPNATTGKVRFVIDHEHVRGWKKMPPELRWQYVRGITCWFCNGTYLGRAMNILKAQNVVTYLQAYKYRRDRA